MEQNNANDPNAGKSLGVAGLVIGIISLIFSFIPCLGAWAFIPAIVGLILSLISMKQAGPNGSKGMAIGGLICSAIAIIFACYWLYLMFFGVGKVVDEFQKSGAMDSLNKAFKMMGDSMTKAVKILEEMKDTTQK
ncbi:MAG: DUF4190 domain-containing protein [Sphingobacteriaceae bacterium]|nr:DUF4190 domain-containing protein [Sphingobacteriaceae bacterium]